MSPNAAVRKTAPFAESASRQYHSSASSLVRELKTVVALACGRPLGNVGVGSLNAFSALGAGSVASCCQ